MPLGTEVGFGPGDIVLDGDPAPPPQKGAQHPSGETVADQVLFTGPSVYMAGQTTQRCTRTRNLFAVQLITSKRRHAYKPKAYNLVLSRLKNSTMDPKHSYLVQICSFSFLSKLLNVSPYQALFVMLKVTACFLFVNRPIAKDTPQRQPFSVYTTILCAPLMNQ